MDTLRSKKEKHPDYLRQLRDCCNRWPELQDRMVSELTYRDFEPTVLTLSSGARGKAIQYLSAVFNYAERKGWASENPTKRMDRPEKHRTEVEVLTVDECERLLKTALEHDKEILSNIILSLLTGVRPEDEALGIKWDDIHFDGTPEVVVRAEVAKRNRRRVREAHAVGCW